MAADKTPPDMGTFQQQQQKKNAGPKEPARKKAPFAEKSYQQRAGEAYQRYLDSLPKK